MIIRRTFLFLISIFILFSCSRLDLAEIDNLNKQILMYPKINHIVGLHLARTSINFERVTTANPEQLAKQLNSLDVSAEAMNEIWHQMENLELRILYRVDDKIIWVRGGAFGDIDGIMFDYDKGPQSKTGDIITLPNKKKIKIRREISSGIFKFSG